jgi:hypothetical protein
MCVDKWGILELRGFQDGQDFLLPITRLVVGEGCTLYAVDPVGVAITRPSAMTEVTCSSSPYNSKVVIKGFGPRS